MPTGFLSSAFHRASKEEEKPTYGVNGTSCARCGEKIIKGDIWCAFCHEIIKCEADKYEQERFAETVASKVLAMLREKYDLPLRKSVPFFPAATADEFEVTED